MKFIDDLKNQCNEYGIKLLLPKVKSIKLGNNWVSGYFDDVNRVIACSMKHAHSLEILIHESCHLDQFIEKSPLWKDSMVDIDEWLAGKEYDKNHIYRSLDNNKWLELDCEKRSVKKFKKYDIPFDKQTYIQKANAYVQFYNYMKYSRKWCDKKNTPYSNKNLYSTLPKKFMPDSWYNELSEKHLKEFIRNKI